MAESEEVLDLRRRARRRLIGAAALVLFLVVVPPWLMDLEPRPVSSNLSVEIPGKDAPKIDARTIPVPPVPAAPGSTPSASVNAPAVPVTEPKASPSAQSDAGKPALTPQLEGGKPASAPQSDAGKPASDANKSAQSASKPSAPATDSTKAGKGTDVAVAKPAPAPAKGAADGERAAAILKNEVFIFQLGAFNNPDNAKAVQQKAAQAGVKSTSETVDTKGVEQTRVVAGPFNSREAAEKARGRLKEVGIEPGPVRAR